MIRLKRLSEQPILSPTRRRWESVAVFNPENVQAAVGAVRPELVHSLVYTAALLAAGILRFARRELHRR